VFSMNYEMRFYGLCNFYPFARPSPRKCGLEGPSPCEIYTRVVKTGPVSVRMIRFAALSTLLPFLNSIIAPSSLLIRRTSGHMLQTIRHWDNTGQTAVFILSFVPEISVFSCQYHSTNAPHSPVSTIPPMLHTPLSVPFHQ
jgi:hypothetical protein